MLKLLYWDRDGYAIWYKRLEKGHFLKRDYPERVLSRKEFFMLLEGIVPKRISRRFALS